MEVVKYMSASRHSRTDLGLLCAEVSGRLRVKAPTGPYWPIQNYEGLEQRLRREKFLRTHGCAASRYTSASAIAEAANDVVRKPPDVEDAALLARNNATIAESDSNSAALQCHGGIELTWEYGLQKWLRRGMALKLAYSRRRRSALLADRSVLRD
ncbi:hypothetical protein [Mycobacterium sp. MUNTM1]